MVWRRWAPKTQLCNMLKQVKVSLLKVYEIDYFWSIWLPVLSDAFVTSVPLGGHPGVATTEVESAVSALRLRGFSNSFLMRVYDFVLRICESEFCHTYRRIRVVRSKVATSRGTPWASKTLYVSSEIRKIAFALVIAHQPLKLKYCFPPSVGTRFLIFR